MLSAVETYRWVRGLIDKKRSHDGKQVYVKRSSAERAKTAMEITSAPKRFDVYRCLWGRHFHIGRSVRR